MSHAIATLHPARMPPANDITLALKKYLNRWAARVFREKHFSAKVAGLNLLTQLRCRHKDTRLGCVDKGLRPENVEHFRFGLD